jgi:hypothetical protein
MISDLRKKGFNMASIKNREPVKGKPEEKEVPLPWASVVERQ